MTPPSAIAHYRITSKLGEGGMGAVYRATDTKLNRDVAIKVLPDSFAHDPDRLARFTREAQVLAALNHPNIATIHGIEQNAIVMELVEGEDLRGPLPLDTALDYAAQIASALEAAHDKGIIHRDLKPANIKVTPQGTIKVLDFGLAKIAEPSPATSSASANSPTLTIHASQAGVILGTAAYMAPEQARGQAVDKRADIWAFGVVLWEMLTGRRMFEGESISDILAGVLKTEPDLAAVPPRVRKLIARCLEKDPRKRLRDIGDWRDLVTDEAPTPANAPSSKAWIAATALLAIALAATGLFWWRSSRAPSQLEPLTYLDLDANAEVFHPAISADGRQVAYVADRRSLMLRRLDDPTPKLLVDPVGAEDAMLPFFSPDGQWVAFFAGGKLKKVSVKGSAAIDLCDARSPRGGSWGDDGFIVVALSSGVIRISASGGQPEQLLEGPNFGSPQVVPGSGAILFNTNPNLGEVLVLPAPGAALKTLMTGSHPRYIGEGRLLYAARGSLFATRFDPRRLEVSGTPEFLATDLFRGDGAFSVSREGSVVMRRGVIIGDRRFAWVTESGPPVVIQIKPGDHSSFRLSPEGNRLAFASLRGSQGIQVHDLVRETSASVAPYPSQDPVWTPDGNFLFYRFHRDIMWTRADGSGSPGQLPGPDKTGVPQCVTRDGKWLVFARDSKGSQDIWIAPIEAASGLRVGTPKILIPLGDAASVSNDGRWIAYQTPANEIYVIPFRPAGPPLPGKWKVSAQSGVWPLFSPTGSEVFYRDDERRIMVVPFTVKNGEFVPDKARPWGTVKPAGIGRFPSFHIDPAGRRILALLSTEEERKETHVRLLLNVLDELRRREGAK